MNSGLKYFLRGMGGAALFILGYHIGKVNSNYTLETETQVHSIPLIQTRDNNTTSIDYQIGEMTGRKEGIDEGIRRSKKVIDLWIQKGLEDELYNTKARALSSTKKLSPEEANTLRTDPQKRGEILGLMDASELLELYREEAKIENQRVY
ncbi:MAG: hypothetical protein AABW46_02490 [Nanoarchaeota archaeon]